jgi:hypothetical protein
VERLVIQVQWGPRVTQDQLVHQVSKEVLDNRDPQDHRGQLAVQVKKDQVEILVNKVQQVKMVILDNLEAQVSLGHRVLRDSLVKLVQWDLRAPLGRLVQLDKQEIQEHLEALDLRVTKASLVQLDLLAVLELQGCLVTLVHRDLQDLKALRDFVDSKAKLVIQVHLEIQATPGLLVKLGHWVRQV